MHISISLTRWEQDALKQLSVQTGLSRHSLIKEAIQMLLQTKQGITMKTAPKSQVMYVTKTLYLHPSILRDLKDFCEKHRVSKVSVIRYCIKNDLSNHPECVHWEKLLFTEEEKKLKVPYTILSEATSLSQAVIQESIWNFCQLSEEQHKFLSGYKA